MKIICVDNFDRDYKSDTLIAEKVDNYYAEILVAFLNSREHENSESFFKAFTDDYKLYKWKP